MITECLWARKGLTAIPSPPRLIIIHNHIVIQSKNVFDALQLGVETQDLMEGSMRTTLGSATISMQE